MSEEHDFYAEKERRLVKKEQKIEKALWFFCGMAIEAFGLNLWHLLR